MRNQIKRCSTSAKKIMIKTPISFIQRLKFIGPSIIVTGSVVGSGSIALSPLLGAATGFVLLWWLLLPS